MGFISHRVKKRSLRPGDHIYSYRIGWIYSHHGIYRGENVVVHYTSESSSSSASSAARSSCPACALLEYRDRKSGVILSCLDCFRKSGSLYRYKYGVKESTYKWRRKGTSNTLPSGPDDVVLARALNLLKNNDFGHYDLATNNCEDFATFCKTGQKCNRNGLTDCYGQASVLGRAITRAQNVLN